MRNQKPLMAITALSLSAVLSACGSSDDSSTTDSSSTDSTSSLAALTGLNDLPGAADMISTNSTSRVPASALIREGGVLAVSGTPPKLVDLNANNVDTYFWNGLLETIGGGGATQAQKDQFWGATNGGVGGEGACRMAESTGYSFQPMAQSGTSLCYMQNIPGATGGVTIDTGGVDKNEIFKQQADDRMVRVNITGMPSEQGGDQSIFINVVGTNNYSSGYKVELHSCDSNGSVGMSQTIEVNKSDLTYSSTDINSQGGSANSATVSGYLKESDGRVVFDASKDRTAVIAFGAEGMAFKSDVTINSSNEIIVKMYDQFTQQGTTMSNKVYAISSFTGSGLLDLRFREGAFKAEWTDGTNSNSYNAAVEFQDTHYVTNTDNALASRASSIDFGTDSFYSTAPSTLDASSLSSKNCSPTVDIELSIDMSADDMQRISGNCESRLNDMNFCSGSAVQAARNNVF